MSELTDITSNAQAKIEMAPVKKMSYTDPALLCFTIGTPEELEQR